MCIMCTYNMKIIPQSHVKSYKAIVFFFFFVLIPKKEKTDLRLSPKINKKIQINLLKLNNKFFITIHRKNKK